MRIFLKTASSLAAAGYEVVLLAPNAGNTTDRGVRIKGYSATGGRLQRFLTRPFKLIRLALLEKPDIVHFHDPELIFVGFALRLAGKKIIYDVHEDYTASIYDRDWIPELLKSLISMPINLVEQLAVRSFSAAVTATETIADRFPKTKTIVTNNYPLSSELMFAGEPEVWRKRTKFAYVGGITRERGILEVLEAVELVRRKRPIEFVLGGVIPDETLQSDIADGRKYDFLKFEGFMNRPEMAVLFSQAVAGLVTFLPLPNHINSRPNKLFEYMSAGLPVIASNFPQWREIVEGERCGICVDPEQPTEIADAMLYLLEHPQEAQKMGHRGKKLVLERLNWANEEIKLLALYRKLLQVPATDSAG